MGTSNSAGRFVVVSCSGPDRCGRVPPSASSAAGHNPDLVGFGQLPHFGGCGRVAAGAWWSTSQRCLRCIRTYLTRQRWEFNKRTLARLSMWHENAGSCTASMPCSLSLSLQPQAPGLKTFDMVNYLTHRIHRLGRAQTFHALLSWG